eukprot:Lankesteria_metandrocarpae@DN5483_c0_g1_i18.p1
MTVTYFGVMCVLQVVGSCSAVRHGNLNVPRDGIMPMMENETSVSDEMFNENYFPSTETSVLTELGQLLLDGIMPMMENVTSVSEEMFDGKYFPRGYSTLPVATNGLPVGINEAHVNYMDSHRSRSRSPRRGSTLPISQSTEASCSPELWNLFLDAVENEPVTSNAKNMPDSHRSRSRSLRRRSTLPVATNGLPVGINEAHVNYMDSHRSRSRSPRRGSTLPISQSTEASCSPELWNLFLDAVENEPVTSNAKNMPDSHRSRSRSPRRRSTLPVATNGLPVGINEAHVNYMDSHRSRSRSPRRGSTLPISQSTEASCSPELWNLFLDAVENEPVTSNAKN